MPTLFGGPTAPSANEFSCLPLCGQADCQITPWLADAYLVAWSSLRAGQVG
jgi:hypothetical protein